MPTQIGNEELYTRQEVAKISGFSLPTIQKKINRGELKPIMFSSVYIFTRHQVLDFLSQLNLPVATIEYRLKNRQEAES
jgi:hypothetical protein